MAEDWEAINIEAAGSRYRWEVASTATVIPTQYLEFRLSAKGQAFLDEPILT